MHIAIHPAYPTTADLFNESVADDLIAAEEAAYREWRQAIEECARKLEGIQFVSGSPVEGYDAADVISSLRMDFMPPARLPEDRIARIRQAMEVV